MRLLTVSSLYPNAAQPHRGMFVRERLRQLQSNYDVPASIVAPAPWFPSRSSRFGIYGTYARIPKQESTPEGQVYHPRYLQIPKAGSLVSPVSFAHAILRTASRYALDCDVIDAHFLFPDGVAAVLAGRRLHKPVVLTARGSDVNLMPEEVVAGAWIRWAIRRAHQLVAVSSDLGQALSQLAGGRAVEVIHNGVDMQRFRPHPCRDKLRSRLGLEGFTLLCVGNLVPLKGHNLVLDALTALPGAKLIIAGDGPLRTTLVAQARSNGVADRVNFVGSIAQDKLAELYAAADVSVLASSHEGLPNVVLESMACGTPVVATPTGGAREVLENSAAGQLVERDAIAIADGIRRFVTAPVSRDLVRNEVAGFDWRRCSNGVHSLFDRVIT